MELHTIISLIATLLGGSGIISVLMIKGQLKRQNIDNLGLMQEQYKKVLTENEDLRTKHFTFLGEIATLKEEIIKLQNYIHELEAKLPKIPTRDGNGKFKKAE